MTFPVLPDTVIVLSGSTPSPSPAPVPVPIDLVDAIAASLSYLTQTISAKADAVAAANASASSASAAAASAASAAAALGTKADASALAAHVADTSNPHAVTKAQVGLGSVDNTSDSSKVSAGPIATALSGKAAAIHTHVVADVSGAAPLASPSFSGTPTVPNVTAGDNSTKAANTAYVKAAIDALINGAPGALDTLKEIADQLASDESAVAALTTTVAGKAPSSRAISTSGLATGGGDLSADRTIAVPKASAADATAGTDDTKAITSLALATPLATKAPLASPTFTGAPAAPTATAGDNSTKLATTAFVATAVASVASGGAVSGVRQTVQGGPQAAGAPSFLPATSSTLSLATQNVSSGTNRLFISAAQGGASDTLFSTTSNLTWSSLTASSTLYLFLNASTGATSFSTLAPIYQFGGTISSASGQFTFDYQSMIGYLGNGSAAVATPLVCVGECVTSGSGVTSTIGYAYNGFYDSGWTATFPTLNGTPTVKSHNLGINDSERKLVIEFTTAQGDYSVGDQVDLPDALYGYQLGIAIASTRTTLSMNSNAANPYIIYKSTAGNFAVTLANVKWKVVAKRRWGR